MSKQHQKKTRMEIFAKYFRGDLKSTLEAMAKDGIQMSKRSGERYMADPKMVKLIQEQANEKTHPGIKTKAELQKFWCEVIEKAEKMEHKLKASELHGKSIAAFTDKHELSSEVKYTIAEILDEDLKTKPKE